MNEDALTDPAMRAAVKAKDPTMDGRFVYGVLTTGVFCRPSCPARPARPENLRFFPDAAAAAKAGFRPCKRCKPEQIGAFGANAAAMADLAVFIEAHSDVALTLKALGARAELSPTHTQRAFKEVFGLSPKAFQDAVRARRFKARLKAGDDVAGAMAEAGYGSASRGHQAAARHLGMTPKAYRSGGAGETIAYATRDTVLGLVLMAATENGVCAVQFGSDAEALRAQLADEFPNATLTLSTASDGPELDAWMTALAQHLSEGAPKPELPLDLRGTAFQMRVWRFLIGLETGEAVSYGEAAQRIGAPKAVRAVASACARNRVAVLVPCHRVLRGDGSLGGYRWRVERKRALLDLERRGRSA